LTKEKSKIRDDVSIVLIGPDGKVKNKKESVKEKIEKVLKELLT